MGGSHRRFRRGNGFDLAVQGFSQATQTKSPLDREHGNQEHDDQDHKKNPHHHENSTAEPRVIGNRNRGTAVRTPFQLRVKLPFTLSAPNRFHIKRLTRLIYRGQTDFLQDGLTSINTNGADSMPPGRHAPYCGPGPGETGTSRIGCLAFRSLQ